MSTLDSLSQQTTATLISLLDDMFTSCDDLYFDLASSAANNQEQNTYFESMREVRVRAASAKQAYEKYMASAFSKPDEATQEVSGEEEMAIVGHEETERQVTLTAMTSRARAVSKTILHEIEQRLQGIAKDNQIPPGDYDPVSPENIVRGFALATDDMDLEINARIILYKQFERLVLRRLPEFYLNFNKKLEESGATYDRSKKGSRSGASVPSGGSGIGSALAGLDESETLVTPLYHPDVQISLSELTGMLRGQQMLPNPGIPLFKSSATGEPLPTDQLLGLLNSAVPVADGGKTPFDLRKFVASLLKGDSDSDAEKAVTQVDEDVINLVAMFFDFALEDEDIPDNVKALLSRLQMPTLKVAIKDSAFFSDAQHPCRQFINQVAQLSIGLESTDEQATTLLSMIDEWIQDIHNEPTDIEGAFASSLASLEQFAKKHQKKSQLIERRTNETAEGEAAKQVARLKAQQAIEEMLDGKHIDRHTGNFITEHWQRVLYNAYLRNGNESNEWTSCLQVMQDLAWSAQPHEEDKKAPARLERILEDLESRLREGLQLTSLSAEEVRQLAQQAVEVVTRYRDKSGDEVVDNSEEISRFVAAEQSALDLLDRKTDLPGDTIIDGDSEALPDVVSQGDSAVSRQRERYNQQQFEFLKKAEEMETGTWLEFKTPSAGTTSRCKLAIKIEETDTYVFVNRFGFKSLEKSKRAFAEDLHRNRARVLRSGALFDRSLGSMIKSLRA